MTIVLPAPLAVSVAGQEDQGIAREGHPSIPSKPWTREIPSLLATLAGLVIEA